jgi:O-acetyl-ADP-ribose deacetylase (regulator of RNase III)
VLLANAYRSCFDLARQYEIQSLAFPSISTGAYGFPIDRAARIALREIAQGLERNPELEKVRVVCFGARAYEIHTEALKATAG